MLMNDNKVLLRNQFTNLENGEVGEGGVCVCVCGGGGEGVVMKPLV